MDRSLTQLRQVAGARALADATRLPFRDESFEAVTAVYMLYHLAHPEHAIAEAARVLRPSGVFIAVAPSRYDSPEFAEYLPTAPLETFDSESGPEMIRAAFGAVEVEPWDAPLIVLPDAAAVRRYLIGRFVSPALASEIARCVPIPLPVTKRGAFMTARKHRD